MKAILMTMLVVAAASASGHRGTAAMPKKSSALAEFSNRDKTGTTRWLGHQATSQVAGDSALAKGRSFEAEGTGVP
jgi:hypothetical protein